MAAGVRAERYDYKGAAASEGTTSAVTPVLPVTSLKRLITVCVEQAGRQRWVGRFHRGKGCFTESQNG